MTPKDVEIVEMAPPDMPAALYAKAVDAYCTGEPFGAAAQRAGYARPLRMTRDEWPQVHLLRADGARGTDQGEPADGAGPRQPRARRGHVARPEAGEPRQGGAIAAGRNFFNQDPKIIRFVMENPTDRVTYGDLRMIRAEFEELMQLSIEAGTLKHPSRLREVRGREFRQECDASRHRNVGRKPMPKATVPLTLGSAKGVGPSRRGRLFSSKRCCWFLVGGGSSGYPPTSTLVSIANASLD